MPKLTRTVMVIDENAMPWMWDGEYLWVQGAEDFMTEGGDMSDVGFYCESLDEMFKILTEGGYITAGGD